MTATPARSRRGSLQRQARPALTKTINRPTVRAAIAGVASYLPEEIVTSEEVERRIAEISRMLAGLPDDAREALADDIPHPHRLGDVESSLIVKAAHHGMLDQGRPRNVLDDKVRRHLQPLPAREWNYQFPLQMSMSPSLR